LYTVFEVTKSYGYLSRKSLQLTAMAKEATAMVIFIILFIIINLEL